MHAFIDESGRKGLFMMCAATVTNGDVASLKGELNGSALRAAHAST
ncbi:MAG: hypothetical protein U5O16_03450 [Rhodococcus sp. (in: high G+C Gram-positive bacteria)]|nr:hypothetical protein [Rhodococcus sp. (in: high G+C Gram-positive bacteria)]